MNITPTGEPGSQRTAPLGVVCALAMSFLVSSCASYPGTEKRIPDLEAEAAYYERISGDSVRGDLRSIYMNALSQKVDFSTLKQEEKSAIRSSKHVDYVFVYQLDAELAHTFAFFPETSGYLVGYPGENGYQWQVGSFSISQSGRETPLNDGTHCVGKTNRDAQAWFVISSGADELSRGSYYSPAQPGECETLDGYIRAVAEVVAQERSIPQRQRIVRF
jgi:hypothetical protein